MKKISVVIPAYNESNNLEVIYQRIKAVFENLSSYSFEIIFVNDGSRDDTQDQIDRLSSCFSEIKYIEFSRNFGHQAAVKAGMDFADGNAVISMDGDLQHPPELIPELIKKWEEGYDVVYTIRNYHQKVNFFKKITSDFFYKLVIHLADFEIVRKGGADFRLLDSSVNEVIKGMHENDLFLRGLTGWVGFRQIGVAYFADVRYSGESGYSVRKMLSLALSGITSVSVKPLYFAAYLGIAFSILSVFLYSLYVAYSFWVGSEVSGWTSLIMTIVFFGGLQLVILGIIGIYLGKVFKQVKERPIYIIRSKKI